MLFIVYLLPLSDLQFILSLSTVFVHLSFPNNCLVFVLVCNHPTTHPKVSTPDGFSEDFLNRLKVRYNMKKGLFIFPMYSQLRAELLSIVRWGLISPQRPQFESQSNILFIDQQQVVSRGSISVKTNRHFEKNSKKKNYDVTKKNFFFFFFIFFFFFFVFFAFLKFYPHLTILNFHLFCTPE